MLALTLACGLYDRVRPLMDGTIGVAGCSIFPVPMMSEDLFPRVVDRGDFDITEMSLSSYLVQVSRNEGEYVALPIFPSRGFRHSGIYVRTDRRHRRAAKDLENRARRYSGISNDLRSLDSRNSRRPVRCRHEFASAIARPAPMQSGRVERLAARNASDSLEVVTTLGEGATLDAALARRRISTRSLSPTPPQEHLPMEIQLVRAALPEFGCRNRTRLFQRDGLLSDHARHRRAPRDRSRVLNRIWPSAFYDAFCEAKRLAFVELGTYDACVGAIHQYCRGSPTNGIRNHRAHGRRITGRTVSPQNREHSSKRSAATRPSNIFHGDRSPLTIDDLFAVRFTSTET